MTEGGAVDSGRSLGPWRWLAVIVLASALAAGCVADPHSTVSEPLMSPSRRPDILLESRRVSPPPALDGNRFVAGWWPWKREGEVLLVSTTPMPRLEGVRVSDVARELVIDGEILEAPSSAAVSLLVAGRRTSTVDLVFPLEFDLPENLPLGRFPIDLELPPETQIAVRSAAFRNLPPAGTAEISETAILQSGPALVDYFVDAAPATTLEVTFEPPTNAGSDQRFELWIERQDGTLTRAFSWQPGLASILRGDRSLSIGLEEGLARIRFASLGDGPPARWHNARLISPSQPSRVTSSGPRRPKLVLVYVMDALRADHLGHLGGPPEASPTIDRLAAEGVTLLDHYSVAPNTFPSIKSLFLGRTPRYDGGWKLAPDAETTLAERFRDAGYRTGLFSGNGLASDLYGTARGFDHVAEEVVVHGFGDAGYSDNAEVVHRAMLDWLETLSAEEPAFIYAQTLHPHNPYAPPRELARQFTRGIDSTIRGSTAVLRGIMQGRIQTTEGDRARLRALYTASIRYNDDLIAELLQELQKRYEPGEFLFVLTSDHGDELFEHGGVLHGYTLYEEQIHVPAVFWWPNQLSPCRLLTPSDHLDLHYTLRALLEEPDPASWQGRSLWSEIETCASRVPQNHLRFVAASSLKGGIFLARSDTLKYIWAPRTGTQWGQGEGTGRSRDGEYIFDLDPDPLEQTNLAGEPLLEAAWLRSRLLAWIASDPINVEDQEEAHIDQKERDRLEALGYLD